ncbi:TonB-dependent Receptor Plug Domain [Granulicella pectinivorans]|uniref:TonB-dependent Receptor Plug Domain n=1 Tax=Granulicella pectinivorans TaxID=474950 RepID=A0A1I6MDJ9_9BACT|nr:carboxypeptidase-like regulatory domain-containing protein [Granulicella pectinivorans]SFS13731.1 TonB-dependent Receptor Plug Domain [Granulicella pectinivorans]
MKLIKIFPILRRIAPLVALLAMVHTAFAQTTASLSGKVQDTTGALVSSAHVVLTNNASKDKRELDSNSAGFFTFAGLIPGTYTIEISATGFRSLRRGEIAVNPGDVRDLTDLALEVGTANETVTVQSSANYIAPQDSGERSALLSTADIERLPIQSRNMSELLKILPGVTTTASGTGNGTGFDFTDTGSSGSAVGVGLNTNGAPYRGGTAYLLDGASIIDPGCACWSIASVNPDMTQEVKVQSSNFGADSPQGPVVINVISRSGSADFHGQAYFYARNGILNANTWQDKHSSTPTARPDASYYYPGGSVGGPILIPGTNFNHNRKLIFWAGFEAFRQNLPASSPLTSYVPTPAMRAGNFSLSDPANAALCAKSTGNDFCQPLTGGFAPDGTALAGTQIPTQYMDPGALALLKLFPAANVDPSTNASGYNYFLQPSNSHNGYIYRGRVDYNISDKNKFFVSYQYGSDSETSVAHIYYNPANAVAFPGGPLISPVHSHVLSGSYIHIFSSSATNEVRVSDGWLDNPYSAANLKAEYNSAIGYPYGTVYSTASLMAPSINSPGARTLPDISQPDLFQQGGTYNSIKKAPSVSDDFTFVYKSHTFKVGGFWSRGGNKQGTYGYTNGSLSYASGVKTDQITGLKIGTVNPLANFLLGITSGFSQNNTNPIDDMYYNTGAGYVLDNWKIKSNLTLNLGLRLEHLGRWQDASGTGLAVWEPSRYAADVAAKKVYPGVYWHAIDSSVPIGGSPVQSIFFEPRLGLAYDVHGNGSTVIRGGWAAYRWNDQYNDFAGPLTTALGVKTYNSNGNQAITLKEISNLGANASSLGSLPSSVYAADQQDDKTGVTYAYNLTISQRLTRAMLFEAAYVGNQTQNILLGGQSNGSGVGGSALVNQNKIPFGGLFKADPVTGAPAPTDPENVANIADYYPYYAGYGTNAISVNTHAGYANYNGLQFSLVRQTGRITFNANYTYSKSLGIVSSTLDAFNVRNNYGVLNIDRPHVINTSYAFDLGNPIHGNKLAAGAVNGWTLTGTTTWQAGGNLQANTNQNMGLTIQNTTLGHTIGSATYYGTNANTVLPILTCNPNSNLKAYQHVNLDCFTAPQLGQVGIRQAPYLSTPAYFDSDLGIYKSFHVTEHQSLELRGTAFNFLNHPLPGFSTSDLVSVKLQTADNKTFTSQVSNTNRGITDAKYTQRSILLAVKYKF